MSAFNYTELEFPELFCIIRGKFDANGCNPL